MVKQGTPEITGQYLLCIVMMHLQNSCESKEQHLTEEQERLSVWFKYPKCHMWRIIFTYKKALFGKAHIGS